MSGSAITRLLRIVFLAAGLAMAAPMTAGAADAADPLMGSWQLDRGKSTFRPGPGPKGQLRIYKIADGVETLTARGISAEGKAMLVQYKARYDGKDYPITGSLGGDRISLKRIDAYTTESTQKRDGKAAIVTTRVVSKDGKVLTVYSKGTTAEGETLDTIMVFDKH